MEDKQAEALSNVLDRLPSEHKSVLAAEIDDAKSTFFDHSDVMNQQKLQMMKAGLTNQSMIMLDQAPGYPYMNNQSAQHIELKKLLLNPDTEN